MLQLYYTRTLPIISCTDPISDLNQIIKDAGIGEGCLSNDPTAFRNMVITMMNKDPQEIKNMGNKGRKYLETQYNPRISYDVIMSSVAGEFE